MFTASKTVRFLFLYLGVASSLVLWLATYLQINWLVYLVPTVFLLAALTGFCPGLIISKWLTGEK